jgi:hypothetical protein
LEGLGGIFRGGGVFVLLCLVVLRMLSARKLERGVCGVLAGVWLFNVSNTACIDGVGESMLFGFLQSVQYARDTLGVENDLLGVFLERREEAKVINAQIF